MNHEMKKKKMKCVMKKVVCHEMCHDHDTFLDTEKLCQECQITFVFDWLKSTRTEPPTFEPPSQNRYFVRSFKIIQKTLRSLVVSFIRVCYEPDAMFSVLHLATFPFTCVRVCLQRICSFNLCHLP